MPELLFRPQTTTKLAVPDLTLAEQIPEDCDVYVFYVPGMLKYEDLKKALLEYGKDAGKTIFVGVWLLASKKYKEVIKTFKIKDSPAVIVSAKSMFSTNPKDKTDVAYARIDNHDILNDLNKASTCITETINLFLQGKVKDAVINAKLDGYKATWDHYFKDIKEAVSKFLKDHSITFDILKGQIIIAPSPPPKANKTKGKASKLSNKKL